MLKHKEEYKSSKTLGRKESALLSELDRLGLEMFTSGDVERILNISSNRAYQILHRLVEKNWIRRIGKGKYLLLSIAGIEKKNLLAQASSMVFPSYISFWSALSYHGFTEQLPQTISVATTKRKKEIKLGNTRVKFITISPSRFFGYVKTESGFIAEPEKALIDSLHLPRYAGGIDEVFKCICNAWKEIDREKLITYAIKMESKSLLKRLGYLIEFGKLNIESIEKMRGLIGKGFSKLDPLAPSKKKYSGRWLLILNASEKKLTQWREVF
jgi:predicted transcriptional regulator of viral defense system